jgi:hypothetical protein
MGQQSGATYDLHEVKELIRDGARRITVAAQTRAINEGFTLEHVYDVVLNLKEKQFYKTMPAEKFPDTSLFQDVYHYDDGTTELYVKVQILNEGGLKKAKVISFKPWGAP